MRVRVLGGFQVRSRSGSVTLPSGRVRLLAALVAVRGVVRVDAAVDLLWPDAPAERGRKRLRNVLLRLHAACPGLVVRADDRLVLGPGVAVDVHEFERAARAASGRDGAAADLATARRAVRLYAGHLLAGAAVDADWCVATRERLRHCYVGLLDELADAAIAEDDIVEALCLLEQAVEADPLVERRYLTSTALLLEQGRIAAARGVLARLDALNRELGLPPSRALQAVRARLDTPG